MIEEGGWLYGLSDSLRWKKVSVIVGDKCVIPLAICLSDFFKNI